jgi:hypothetical protein
MKIYKRKTLTDSQIKDVVSWMNEWEQLKDTSIPLRFKEAFSDQDRFFLDYYLGKCKWYRNIRKGTWYLHEFTPDALQLSLNFTGKFWTRYGEINRYSRVIGAESYSNN